MTEPTQSHVLKRLYARFTNYLSVTPILVTLSIIAISLVVSILIQRNLESIQSQAVTKQVRENEILIQNTFQMYSQVAWSGAGRMNSGAVDRDTWARFVGTYNFPQNFPAIASMGVTRNLHPDQQQAFIDEMSQIYGQPIQITKGDAANDVNVLAFVAPEKPSSVNNIGFNVYSDAARRNAMIAATDEGKIAMTDQLELIINARQDSTSDGPAFLLYAPYYAQDMPITTPEERRAALLGHVSVAFRTNEVFEQIFSHIDRSHVAMTVSIGKEKRVQEVYKSHATAASGPQIYRTQTMEIYGQPVVINYVFDRNFLVSSSQLHGPLWAFLSGCFVAFLTGTVTFFFLRGRHHRLLLDKEREVNRAKDELLSLASHQLRTPATGVKQYLGMVLQGFAGKTTRVQEELLEKAYKSNERQLHVINDILHLAKLDLGMIVLAKTNFDLGDLIGDVLEEQMEEVKAGQLKVSKKLLKSSPIYGDKHMLRMVIENLLSNAIKYTDPGGSIKVRLTKQGDEYHIAVKDTGVGIASNDMSKLFKQFSRVMNPRSHLVTGTGVGLYLSKHLVQLHHGDIRVESKLDKGSTFTLVLPRVDESL